ncbi:MAG: Flp family type IVb pilin [Bacteroidales bacterium]|nr:Flp family type IVb pilin [Bacteroidales bacterium]
MLTDLFKRLWAEETGQGMVEYGLILALIAVVVIAALTGIGTKINAKFTEIEGNL